MQSIRKSVSSFLVAILLGLGWPCISLAETVTVDDNMTNGFMGVFALDGSGAPNYAAYQFGNNWGLADVKSTVSASSNPLFPALRSDPMALSGASRRKQIPLQSVSSQ